MPRTYKRKPGSRKYTDYSQDQLTNALADIAKGLSVRQAGIKWDIPKDTLHRRIKGTCDKLPGRQTVFTVDEETIIADNIMKCQEWGYPLDLFDLKLFIKMHLDTLKRNESRFKNNCPGKDFVYSFLKRNKTLSIRNSQNVKAARAAISVDIVNSYFDNLTEALKDIPSTHILNYDETNLTDDPGSKKVICKRGCKRVEKVMNHSKSSTSIMFTVSGSGHMLPVYTVYKAVHLYDLWTENGPVGARYNRSKSGWFEGNSFADWFETVALRHLKTLDGEKVIIGDNLSTHINPDIIQKCAENNIKFIFLPANSTHLTQPLDVSLFRPLKISWRKILNDFKIRNPKIGVVPKERFPSLLKDLVGSLKDNLEVIIKNGFRKTGIIPLNRHEVISCIPQMTGEVANTASSASNVSTNLIDFLKERRFGADGDKELEAPKRKKRLQVPAGKSISVTDLESSDDDIIDDQNDMVNDMLDEQDSASDVDENVDNDKDDSLFKGIVSFDISEDSEDTFVLVKYIERNNHRYYMGRTLGFEPSSSSTPNKIKVKFLRQHRRTLNQFIYPVVDDIDDVSIEMIAGKAVNPQILRHGQILLNVDSSQWK